MPKKKPDKKIECFSASFNDILICQNNDARPFMEVFVEDPENITQQNLGILAGILEITDPSEDSSYIVNYLISVIKKEYYSKPKRGTIESFEAALRKANLALAKLAEHENIAWIGKTNAILLVIEKNNLHLSQSGNARALLLRGKTLTDISEDPDSATPPNPIKTFTDIVSGRLEEADKLIITTNAMFDLFSQEEIKRSALKFSSPEFIQFLKTALVNESERAATLIVEIKKEEKAQAKATGQTARNGFNAFSQSAFSKRSPAAPKLGISAETYAGTENAQERNSTVKDSSERQALVNEIKEELAKNTEEFVDKKTGHIYIKGTSSPKETSDFLETLSAWQDKISAYASSSVEIFKTPGEKSRALKISKISQLKDTEKSASENAPAGSEKIEESRRSGRIPAKTKTEEIKSRLTVFWKENYPAWKNFFAISTSRLIRISKIILNSIWQKTKALGTMLQVLRSKMQDGKKDPDKILPESLSTTPISNSQERKELMERYHNNASSLSAASPSEKISARIVPDFSHLKNIFSRMDYSQRLYAALAIVLLFIVPYFLAKIGTKPKQAIVTQEAPRVALPLEQDKNVTRVEKIDSVYTGQDISNVINLNDSVFAVSAKGIVDVANSQNYPFPENFTPTHSVGMDDINFVFFMNQDNRIISWSPASKKFQDNTIEIPSGTRVASIGTYLTYLYVTDSANGQIYRYPRDTGGFGQKIDWLKGATDLSQIKNMAIGENVYLIDKSGLLKFFQGKKQDFALEATATPIKADALFTKHDDQFLYILDKTNARVIKTDLNGAIVAQYYNADLTKATSFTVDEKNNNAYVSTASGVGMFGMN